MKNEVLETFQNQKEEKVIRKIKNTADIQRLKLEKLMNNPTKPVVIPERIHQSKVPSVPEFVRNVMGSSAGAGSGEFHVYRHLRRKEFARQKYIAEQAKKEELDRKFEEKIQKQQEEAMEKTAKKRAKRLKKKEKLKSKKKIKSIPKDLQQISLEDDTDDMDSN